MFQKKAGRKWTWKSPNGVAKTEIDYILKTRPYIGIEVTVVNQVNTGSDHRMVISNIKLNVQVEREETITKRPSGIDAKQIRSKKIEFQLELRN